MQIFFLIFAVVAVVLGFVGLITIIKGFVDKNNSRVWLGTIMVCIMLILGVCGAFVIAKKALVAKRVYQKTHGMINNSNYDYKCMHDAFKSCCPGDTTICGDSTEMQVIVEKKCIKKGDGKPCPHHMN
ncbi:MAG TPA: hypothetical protein PKN48_03955 [Bacteroidales bacterium]|nr:hypothetical protein [Bacteroidales bacterium]